MGLKEILNKKNCLPAQVVSIDKTPTTKKTGFISEINFLTLHLANGDEMNMVLKTELESKEQLLFLDSSEQFHKIELNFYEKVYPELEQSMGELNLPSPVPKCYYTGAIEDGPVIVLDDLTRRGLKLPTMETDIPENDLRSILRSLAIVQAGACALQLRREASLLELFPFLKNVTFSIGMQKLNEKNLDSFKEAFIKQYPDESNLLDLISIIAMDTDLNEHFYCGKDAGFCLSHGDLWNYNVFINDNECVLIDWQCLSAGCSTGDIATLVGFGIDLGPEPSKRFESLVRYYLDFMLECCGDNAALREMVEQRVVPFMSSAKMRRMSLQFAVKWIIFCSEGLMKAPQFLLTRVIRNTYHILSEASH